MENSLYKKIIDEIFHNDLSVDEAESLFSSWMINDGNFYKKKEAKYMFLDDIPFYYIATFKAHHSELDLSKDIPCVSLRDAIKKTSANTFDTKRLYIFIFLRIEGVYIYLFGPLTPRTAVYLSFQRTNQKQVKVLKESIYKDDEENTMYLVWKGDPFCPLDYRILTYQEVQSYDYSSRNFLYIDKNDNITGSYSSQENNDGEPVMSMSKEIHENTVSSTDNKNQNKEKTKKEDFQKIFCYKGFLFYSLKDKYPFEDADNKKVIVAKINSNRDNASLLFCTFSLEDICEKLQKKVDVRKVLCYLVDFNILRMIYYKYAGNIGIDDADAWADFNYFESDEKTKERIEKEKGLYIAYRPQLIDADDYNRYRMSNHIIDFDHQEPFIPSYYVQNSNQKDDDYNLLSIAPMVRCKPASSLYLHPEIQRFFTDFLKTFEKSDLLTENGLSACNRLLLAGPPGNGKTSLAKSFAYELNCPCISVNLSEIMGRYWGSANARVSGLFYEFHSIQSSVIIFDECETVFAERNCDGSSGDRYYSETVNLFLQEMDRFPHRHLLIACTNFPDSLDKAFLRRFPDKLWISPPDGRAVLRYIQRYEMEHNIKIPKTGRAFLRWSDVEHFCKKIHMSFLLGETMAGLKKDENGWIGRKKEATLGFQTKR